MYEYVRELTRTATMAADTVEALTVRFGQVPPSSLRPLSR